MQTMTHVGDTIRPAEAGRPGRDRPSQEPQNAHVFSVEAQTAMELALLPLKNDDVLRVGSHGPVSRRDSNDPLQTLLGPLCYGHKVLLNLEESQGIDTSCLCWLVNASKRFSEAGGKLVLFAVPPMVLDVLDFLNLTSLLHIAPNEQAACELVSGRAHDPDAEPRPARPAIRFPGDRTHLTRSREGE